jgi:hypothetical protein
MYGSVRGLWEMSLYDILLVVPRDLIRESGINPIHSRISVAEKRGSHELSLSTGFKS